MYLNSMAGAGGTKTDTYAHTKLHEHDFCSSEHHAMERSSDVRQGQWPNITAHAMA